MKLSRPLLMSFACLLLVGELAAQEKNSTRKLRIRPTEFSGQCGSAVQWRESVAAAMAESESTGKPVFWYIPTVAGSFMDRLPVIDRYMLAGPFSWPSIAGQINDHFIPVKAAVEGALQEKYELQRYQFVEPGFVVLDSGGQVSFRIDQLTTLNPQWFGKLVAGAAGREVRPLSTCRELAPAWRALGAGNFAYDVAAIEVPAADAAERVLLQGMLAFRRGEHDLARKIWRTAQDLQPAHPLAWKAAAEAENWGPFVRGFEVHRDLPEAALAAGIRSRGSAAPARLYSEKELWARSTSFLLDMQAADGGWVDSDYDFGGTDSLPNVYVAVTALCGNALLDSLSRMPERQDELRDAISRAAAWCSDKANLNYVDRDEILWAHAYRVRFLSRLVSMSEGGRETYGPALATAIGDLEAIQTKRGTWYHEYANPFVTATALTALKHAEAAGAGINQDKIRLGVQALANDRFDNGAYPYSSSREPRPEGADSSGQGRIPASAGRMPLCEMALWLWDGSDDRRLQSALTAAFENHRHLEAGYKYDNHTSRMAYGGFFFWYDMRSRAEALRLMTAKKERREFAALHRNLVLDLPELDGCFVDSHELGRCYGTAMALQTLALLDQIDQSDQMDSTGGKRE